MINMANTMSSLAEEYLGKTIANYLIKTDNLVIKALLKKEAVNGLTYLDFINKYSYSGRPNSINEFMYESLIDDQLYNIAFSLIGSYFVVARLFKERLESLDTDAVLQISKYKFTYIPNKDKPKKGIQ